MLASHGHPQDLTPVKSDNKTTAQFVTNTIKHKHSKSWDVWYFWLAEKQSKGKFNIYWDCGSNNLVDYHIKHHSPTHHQTVRKTYILQKKFKNIKVMI